MIYISFVYSMNNYEKENYRASFKNGELELGFRPLNLLLLALPLGFNVLLILLGIRGQPGSCIISFKSHFKVTR